MTTEARAKPGPVSNWDLIAAAALTGAVALAPFVGWGTPGDHPGVGLGWRAVSLLAALMVVRRGGIPELVGLPALAATALALRFAPSVGGFAPYLFLPALAGYLRGPRAGFAAGVATALAAGTVEPGAWVFFQLIGAGWMGALAGVTGQLSRRAVGLRGRLSLGAACLAGGYLYGVLLNATVWSGAWAGAAAAGWGGDVPLPVGLAHFLQFYVATALPWDTLRGLGLAAMAIALPWPLLLRVRLHGLGPKAAEARSSA